MKKNVMMRVASIMLVLVLMSSSVISGTFAKYVTEGESEDSARVAKFGVTVTANFEKLFTRGYKEASLDSYDTEDGASVWADADVGVVAPGTHGSLADFDIEGAPEVDVQVSYDADLQLAKWFVDHDDDNATDKITYCPVVFTVNTDDFYIGGNDLNGTLIETAAQLEAAVEDAIEKKAKVYHTTDDLNNAVSDLDVSWTWHFQGSVEHTGSTGPACQYDALDTKLGDVAAANEGEAATIYLYVSCTVTQID